jgi:hypothetical protein
MSIVCRSALANLSFLNGCLRFLSRGLDDISFYCAFWSIIPYVFLLTVLYLYIWQEDVGFSFYYYQDKNRTDIIILHAVSMNFGE